MDKLKDNIFLVGFSGTGKTNVGKALAQLLNYEYVDTDLQIEANTERSVQEIFAQDGEAAFREIEQNVLEKICEGNYQVVATGGGMVLAKSNRTQMTANGYVVMLEARPETIYVRLLLDTKPGAVRPLLQGENQFEKIAEMKSLRQPFYAEADWTIHTDFMTPEEVAGEIQKSLPYIYRRGDKQRGGPGSPASPGSPHSTLGKASATPFHRGGSPDSLTLVAKETTADFSRLPGQVLTVRSSGGIYPVVFGENLLEQVGELLKTILPDSAGRAVFVITDESIAQLHGRAALNGFSQAGYRAQLKAVPSGDESKSAEQVAQLYNWLAANRAERKDIVVAVGGGVIGDLAGFVAASWLRGINFVQVPTTLLAMVDSSVGGKTGINHASGKNLIGAFYPPKAVFADVLTLTSLPERARHSGWAEVIKHAVIPGAADEAAAQARFSRLEQSVPALNAGDMAVTAAILRESVAVKAGVVEEDEYETGLRMTLNYGHTYAHALETAGGYTKLMHGEAVAIGMQGVARLAQEMGLCSAEFVARQKALLEGLGLPTSAWQFELNRDTVLQSMKLDKKVESGSIRWIIPRGIGRLEIRRDVPNELVARILDELL